MAKIALVTGFTSVLGKQISETLAETGYIVYAGVRQIKDLSVLKKNIRPLVLNITDDASCEAAVRQIIKKSKKLDVLVNVAGMSMTGPYNIFSSKDFLKLLDVNIVGAFRLTKAAAATMSSGYIINISSLSGFMSSPNYALYSATKHALQAFDWAVALELTQKNIHLVTLAPGALLSHSAANMSHLPARQALPILARLMPLTPPRLVADEIIKIVHSPTPPPVVLVGRDAQLIYILQKLLPSSIWFGIQNWLWRKQQ